MAEEKQAHMYGGGHAGTQELAVPGNLLLQRWLGTSYEEVRHAMSFVTGL